MYCLSFSLPFTHPTTLFQFFTNKHFLHGHKQQWNTQNAFLFMANSNSIKSDQCKPIIPQSARVAVIGAGASGLASARQLHAAGYDTSVFEASDQVGGLWRYSSDSRSSSPIYASLRTNLPKQVMTFEGDTYSPDMPTYLPHAAVYEYLISYAKRHNLYPLISFKSPVTSVQKVNNQWIVSTQTGSEYFDAVTICVGHFSKPRLWEVEGIGHLAECGISVHHSMSYKTPGIYKNERVLVIGAGPSGIDIAIEVSSVADHVYFSHSKIHPVLDEDLTGNITEIGRVIRVLPNGSMLLQNGDEIAAHKVICCTGYRQHYPFLRNGTAGVRLTEDGRNLEGVVRHCVAVDDPTLSFIGVPQRAIVFPMYEEQIAFFIAVLQGKVCSDRFAVLAAEESLRDINDKNYHVLGERQWDYIEEMAALAGRKDIKRSLIEICNHSSKLRKRYPRSYRERQLVLLGEGSGMWREI